MSALDGAGQPTGDVFQTPTLDDLGSFAVELPAAGAYAFEANGFYYNEVSGSLSTGALGLRAYAVLEPGEASTYLNIVTHLVASRVPLLVADGQTPADSIAQAELELRTALGIGLADFDPGAAGGAMTILGGDTPANAYLLAVSAVLAQVGVDDAGGLDGPVDAALQEFLNVLASDLADDGAFEPARRAKIDDAELSLDPDAMMVALAQRLVNTGSDAVVPDVNAVLDADADGLVNELDNCRKAANPGQQDTDGDTVGDACDVCPDIVDLDQADADGDGKGDVCDSDCGDEFLGPGEICDGAELAGESCASLGHLGGALACMADCSALDETGCFEMDCGDGEIQGDEICDTGDLAGQTCEALGYDAGELACANDCSLDESGCESFGCGDGELNTPMEACDGGDFGSATCESLGYAAGGYLLCNAQCIIDPIGCCGSNSIGVGEECDLTEIAGQGCQSLGYTDGTLNCGADCTFDTSLCSLCGDGEIVGNEHCDGDNLDGNDCLTHGFNGGVLTCNLDCQFEFGECHQCGNGQVGQVEECDGLDLAGMDCLDLGHTGGALACDADCLFDESGCTDF
ncbi:MAG TPA: hypothetical protein VG755_12950 [Nannocystaceae bacterium]|nr:hypothetical protein [Nannocystaceae bacterium]